MSCTRVKIATVGTQPRIEPRNFQPARITLIAITIATLTALGRVSASAARPSAEPSVSGDRPEQFANGGDHGG